MRNRELHDALRAFALETAALLREDQERGAEIEFDLDEGSRRGGPTLYHYRPLTAKFVADRWPRLRALPTFPSASLALGAGAAAYLRINGLRGAEAEPALRAMLERLYEDATDLSFPEERFERVYTEVERTLYERSQPATVLAPIHGLVLDVERLDLGGGLALVRGGATDAPDDALWSDPGAGADDRREPNVLVTLTRDVSPDAAPPLTEARERFGRLVTGLRLWKQGGIALSTVGWRRTGEGVWQPFEIEPTGVARGAGWALAEGEDADLLEFLAAIDRTRPVGSVAWALSRFEMGCGRGRESEALSDYLLGLRALLERRGDEVGAGLALRVAVLCAEEGQRRGVQRQVELAQTLERFVMGDSPDDDYMDAIGSDSPRTLVDELERHLRALLRDVLCGYLDADLRALSDELLLEQPPQPAVTPPLPEPATQPATAAAATEIESLESRDDEIGVTAVDPGAMPSPGEPQRRRADGVGLSDDVSSLAGSIPASTAAEDLDWDDAGYSAPV